MTQKSLILVTGRGHARWKNRHLVRLKSLRISCSQHLELGKHSFCPIFNVPTFSHTDNLSHHFPIYFLLIFRLITFEYRTSTDISATEQRLTSKNP